MTSLNTLILNAGQKLLNGTIDGIDFAGLRVACDLAPHDEALSKRSMLLTLAAQCAAPGAIQALREHGLVIASGSTKGCRLTHASLRYAHQANVEDTITILAEDLEVLKEHPSDQMLMGNALWAWQLIDPPIRKALLALGAHPVDTVTDGTAPFFTFKGWRLESRSKRRAAAALLAD